MKKIICLILCIYCGCCYSQKNKITSFNVYFESNQYLLQKRQVHIIDSVITELNNIPEAFEVIVKAHTDQKGSIELNNKLSKNRASTVINYLVKKGFKTTDSTLNYYAFNQPIETTLEQNYWKNRRAEIIIYKRVINFVKAFGITDFTPQEVNLNEDKGGVLTFDSTKITVTPNSFRYSDNREVVGDILIKYQSYKNSADFLLADIPMSFIDQGGVSYFESGGMFKIEAFQNGEKLILKKEKKIEVEMPLKKVPNQNFYLFDSTNNHWNQLHDNITNNNGIINPRIPGSSNVATKSDFYIYPNCIVGDTCKYFDNLFKKMEYYLKNNEPLLINNAYKSVKHKDVDYHSPYYIIEFDSLKKTFKIKSINGINEMGSFSNYTWSCDEINGPLTNKSKYASFVKIVWLGENKFQLKMNVGSYDKRTFNVTGKYNGFSLFRSQTKSNEKNNKKYLKELLDFDNQEITNDNRLKSKFEITTVDEQLFYDSLNCLKEFYLHFLTTKADSLEIVNYSDFYTYFNVNKQAILKSMNQKKVMFNCEDYKKKVANISLLERAKIEVLAKFGLTSTGVFNADAVKNIKDSKTINATYINKKTKKTIPIICIFVNIKNLNALIRYDGAMGYGPYHFAFSQNEPTTIIAVDADYNTFFCSPADFNTGILNSVNGNATFYLTPIKDLNKKENLTKIME